MPSGDYWKKYTPEQYAAHCNNLSVAANNRPPEASENYSKGQRERFANMTPVQLASMYKNMEIAQIARRLNETPEQVLIMSKKVSASFAARTPEQELERNRKISEAQKSTWSSLTEEERTARCENISIGTIRAYNSKSLEEQLEFGRICSETLNSRTLEELDKVRTHMREGHARRSPEKEALRRKSISTTLKEDWLKLTEEEQGARMRKAMKGMQNVQTYPELLVEIYLKKSRPKSSWRYNGLGPFTVGSHTPDFINTTTKEVILVHGTAWHSLESAEKDILYYEKRGWKCIIIWEYDTASDETLNELIKS
jgi:G:T-mismatch repair DNA endonuclease (very short patch repair protein)